ncbi:uncharacterized protein F4822DRAFT_35606 [Hypoxylon trugodes]|uniref:uncharacterized protein n=1 Tax=Hypoxylon trugodes TaxID=326681 RepID=UPI002192737C|nr:uncharacterized protein F4822DRAFT_35606 [Hypoxylon trugodes]KAI1394071.1 hypothetical protein F4822DRAFT_35606 [Hypoxylon trugodes]
MATDSLRALIVNIPDWLKRLEELNGQIDQRQQDLAMLPENRPGSSAQSMRNRGSTESLKPRDEGALTQQPDTTEVTPPPPTGSSAWPKDGTDAPITPVHELKKKTSRTSFQQTREVMATAQRRARATVRKRQKTDSMLSHENSVQKYRSRNMIIVYYDSYVQSFFEELVKFVSIQRNSMRKAKMAAKVARIRRLAEIEMPDEEDEDEGHELKPRDTLVAATTKAIASNYNDDPDEPKLHFMSTQTMGSRNMMANRRSARVTRSGLTGGLGSFQDKGDIWEELDKGLEFVQGMCEHGAHQFLRDGDCSEEVAKIKARLAQTKDTADRELARIEAGVPDDMDATAPMKSRSFRPMTMRRTTPSAKAAAKQNVVEVEDEGIQDMDNFQPASKPAKQEDRVTS